MNEEQGDTHRKLLQSIAKLETKVDLLESEITYLNKMLIDFGFNDGIESLKQALNEMNNKDDDSEAL
jgi:hypothetical protein